MPIAYGTDSAVFPHGLNAREFGDYVDMGMSPAAALMTSSQGSAKLLGIDKDTGTLEAGKAADIVAVPGDVIRDIRATEKPVLPCARWRSSSTRSGSCASAAVIALSASSAMPTTR